MTATPLPIGRTLAVGLLLPDSELAVEVRSALRALEAQIAADLPAGLSDPLALTRLEHCGADLLLAEFASLGESPAGTIATLKALPGHPALVVVHPSADAGVILRALRAGADEFVSPPFSAELGPALQRVAAQRRQGHAAGSRGRVIGFLSAKGGCGATTVACHVAAELRRQTAKPVLVADFDIEDGLAAFLLRSEPRYTVVDLLANLTRLDESLWHAMVNPNAAGVDVLASPGKPSDEAAGVDATQLLDFARGLYDWTLVDLGRSHSRMLANVGAELDELYLVTTPEIPALHHARHLLGYIERCGVPAERTQLVLNREAAHGEITAKELGVLLHLEVAGALPDEPRLLHEALAGGKLADANSRLGRRVAQLGARLAGSGEPARERRKLLFLF